MTTKDQFKMCLASETDIWDWQFVCVGKDFKLDKDPV